MALQQLPAESSVCRRLVPDGVQKTALRFWEAPAKLTLWQGGERERCQRSAWGQQASLSILLPKLAFSAVRVVCWEGQLGPRSS